MRGSLSFLLIIWWIAIFGHSAQPQVGQVAVLPLPAYLHQALNLDSNEVLVQQSAVQSPFGIHYSFIHYVNGKQVLHSIVNYHSYNNQSNVVQNFLVEPFIDTWNEELPLLLPTASGLVSVRSVKTGSFSHPVIQYLDENNDVLFEQEEHKYYQDTTVSVNVFEVNPINSANTVYGGLFVDNGDASNASLSAQRDWKNIYARYSNDTFYLESEYIKFVDNQSSTVVDSVYWQFQNDSFDYERNEQFFEMVNVYYHIQNFATYITEHGFKPLTTQLKVDPHGFSGDNSWFAPSDFSLTFGDGGVDDGEDGEVVIHEYIHALSEKASLNTTVGNERKAMEEGSCDYLSKAYSRTFNDNSTNKVFSWDGHNEFWNGFEINTDRLYPSQLANTKDGDRDIWSSALMCGHDAIGRETMDSLVLMHFYYQGPNTTMSQMAQVILDIDSTFFNQRNYTALKGCFANAGFLEYGAGIPDIESPVPTISNTIGFAMGTGAAVIQMPDSSTIKIHNSLGQLVATHFTKSLLLNPDEFPKGLYIITIEGENSIHSFKLLR